MDLDMATEIAEQWVARCAADSRLKLKLHRGATLERDFGWVFFYGPEDTSILIAGNAPIIVDRKSGSVHVTGTASPLEEYLETYARAGRTNPLLVPEYLVILEGWKPGMLKISLTKAIRAATGKNLAEAKDCTDSLLDGKAVTLAFPSAADADRFCCDVETLGVLAQRTTRYH
jgi:ribosomal protein L7/L12